MSGSNIVDPSLRIKITGVCNRTCNFCNEEGDMKGIDMVVVDSKFYETVSALQSHFGIKRIMPTGGEPTIHSEILDIINNIIAEDISITTNGIRPVPLEHWKRMKESGLSRVIFSIHDANPQDFLRLESQAKSIGWAFASLENQKSNCYKACSSGLNVRVNIVAYSNADKVMSVINMLSDIQSEFGLRIRILNDLSRIESSRNNIKTICQKLGAIKNSETLRKASSNKVETWVSESGMVFETKEEYPYYLDGICQNCSVKNICHEGFYGLRLESRQGEYFIRLCAYKNSSDVLIPFKKFLSSNIAEEYLRLLVD